MKVKNLKLISLFSALFLFGCSDYIEFQSDFTKTETEIVVDFHNDVSTRDINALGSKLKLDFKPNSPLFATTKVATINVPNSRLEEVEDMLEDSGLVNAASNNITYSVPENESLNLSVRSTCTDCDSFPNDELYDKQWNLKMIGMEEVWDMGSMGDNAVVVAVLDTGISDGTHSHLRVPDLANSCILRGINFIDGDDNPYDGHGHGTHVAGTIAQSTNNDIGVAGVAPNTCILPMKVFSDEGYGDTANIIEAIDVSVMLGANVINMSLGGPGYEPALEKAVNDAADKDVVVVCAAGNNNSSEKFYPAGYDGCLSISAVDKNKQKAFYSNFGESNDDIFMAAPGGDTRANPYDGILQDTIAIDGSGKPNPNAHGYYPFQGTSMAAPHVSGVAALIIAESGSGWTLDEVMATLEESAEDLGNRKFYGHGLVNAAEAVKLTRETKEDLGIILNLSMLMFAALGFMYARKIGK